MNSRLYRWSLRVSWAINALMAFTLIIVVFFPLQMGKTPWVTWGDFQFSPIPRGLCIWRDPNNGFNYPFFNGIIDLIGSPGGPRIIRDINDQRHLLYRFRGFEYSDGSVTWALAIRPWFLWPIFVVLPGVQLLTWYRQRRLQRKGCCHKCSYDLRGNPAAIACPECGTARPIAHINAVVFH